MSSRERAPRRTALRRACAGLLLAAITATLTWQSLRSPSLVYLLYVAVSLALGGIATTTLAWTLHAWRTPSTAAESRLPAGDVAPAHRFSVIVPARHEEAVLETTLTRLITNDHPSFTVLVVVGADDLRTREVAERVAGRNPGLVRVIVDDTWPKTKPRALNAALPHCTGTITCVFDAEDDVHPGLLRRVDQCFQQTDADIVQSGVQLMNFRSRWWTVHNVLEYYFWFRSRLHLHARQRFIPLGGNTVFVRTRILQAVAGWDPDCLAEDCELGVRLSSLGARTVVFYEPELVTREECPPTLRAFVKQRTRWNQGYLQTLARGYWRRLPLRQRALGSYILAMPFVMAITWLLLPVALGTALAMKAPIAITLISFVPLLPMLSMLVVQVVALKEFGRTFQERVSARDYGRLVLGLLPYQIVLSFAAARSVARHVRGVLSWEKTSHVGLHLAPTADARSGADPSAGPAPWRPGRTIAASGSAALRPVREWARRRRPAGDGATSIVPEQVGFALAAKAAGQPLAIALPAGDMVLHAPVANYDSARAALGSATGPTPALATPAAVSPRQAEAGHPAGNGRGARDIGLPRYGSRDGGPLWMRLDTAPAAGSGQVTLPPTGTAAPERQKLRIGDVRSRVRGAVVTRAGVAVPLALLAVVGVVMGTNFLHWPATQFDEGTYMGDAWALQFGRLAPYTFSYGHPPLGWLLIAFWTSAAGLFGHASYLISTGREFMLAVNLVSCALLYALARRLEFSQVAAAASVIIFGLSPIGIFYHRAILLDNPSFAWALAAFALAWTPRRRLWAFTASGACFAIAALCKETTLLVLPALVVAVVQNTDRRTRSYCLALFGAAVVFVGGFYPLYATLKGELLPGSGHVSLVGYVILQLITRQGTGSLFDAQSQTHLIVANWLGLDPWLLGLALALAPVALARRTTRAVAIAFLTLALAVLRPGYLPNMYVIGLLPFGALMIPGSFEAAWHLARRGSPATGRAVQVAVAAAALALILVVAPRWSRMDHAATTERLDGPQTAAERWLVRHIGRNQRLIVNDQYWIYLIEHGFNHQPMPGGFFSRTVVSYWPLDYDPAVKRAFPQGWRDFNYIVVTQAMRDTLPLTPTTVAAINHSRLVASFGKGPQQVQVRAIVTTTTSPPAR